MVSNGQTKNPQNINIKEKTMVYEKSYQNLEKNIKVKFFVFSKHQPHKQWKSSLSVLIYCIKC